MTSRGAVARPLTTQEHVLAELRRMILRGALVPGEPIRADQIAAELEVSRVPVREALKILEGEGQVTYRPHHGYVLAELRLEDLRENYRIRRLLEDDAAGVALGRITDEDVQHMRDAIEEMEALGPEDPAAMAVVNRRFHFVLLEAAGMPQLMHHVRLLWNASDHYRSVYYADAAYRREVHDEHRQILAAVTGRDPDALRTALDGHRDRAIEGLRAILKEEP